MARKQKFLPGDPRRTQPGFSVHSAAGQEQVATAAEGARRKVQGVQQARQDAAVKHVDAATGGAASREIRDRQQQREQARDRRERWGYKEPPKISNQRRWMPQEGRYSAKEIAAAKGLDRTLLEAHNSYMDQIAKSKLFTPQQEGSATAHLSQQQKRMASMMLFGAVQSLENGLSAPNIMRMVGMSMMMWKLSPDFKAMVSDGRDSIKDGLTDSVEKFAAERAAKGKPGWERWQMLTERMHSMRDGDRLPYTAQSAAMAEVAMGDRVYSLLRLDGVDVDDVVKKYQAALENLYKMADYDGVNADEIAKESRKLVGDRIMQDPSCAARYQELFQGEYSMAPDRKFKLDGKDVYGWDGEFEHSSGALVNGGTFTPRPKMSAGDHYQSVWISIRDDLLAAPDVEDLHSRMMTFAMGWGGAPDSQVLKGMDRSNPGRRRLETSLSMMQAMADDGFDDGQAQDVYTNAFMDALREVEQHRPDAAAQWSARYGESWHQTLKYMKDNPGSVKEFWQRAEQRNRGEDRSSAGNRGTYSSRDHQPSQTYGETNTAREQPGPSQTWSSTTTEAGSGRSGDDPVHRYRDAGPATDMQARRAEMVKRNQRYNEAGPSPVFRPSNADITGSGVDSSQVIQGEVIEGRVLDDDEPSP